MRNYRHRGHAETNVGRRENNEDSFVVAGDVGLYAVADGMGGHEGGEVASKLVVETLEKFFRRCERGSLSFERQGAEPSVAELRMDMAIRMAHRQVQKESQGHLAEMGSTVAAVLLESHHALIAHVGDSRVYRLRDGELEQLTRDHSLVSDLEAAGCGGLMANLPMQYNHMITRSIAAHSNAQPDLRVEETRPGDVFLLCSDGLTDVMTDEDITDVLTEYGTDEASAELVRRAYDAGSQDNITCVVFRVEEPEADS